MTVHKDRSTHRALQDSEGLVQAPHSATGSAARGNNTPGYNYNYGEEFGGTAMQANPLQYQPNYAQESQRQQQQFPHYGMYTTQHQQQQQQQLQHVHPQLPYDSVQPYHPRQSAAIEVLSTQFGVPGVPQQYYVASDGGPTSAPTAAMIAQNVPSNYPQVPYNQQSPVGRDAMGRPPPYSPGSHDPTQNTYIPPSQYAAPATSQFDAAYDAYQTALRRTFEQARDGQLGDAGISLLEISSWLLGNVESLGLVRDDENMAAERTKLWDEFNRCWLAVLQKQKDMTQEMLDTEQEPQEPQSLLEIDFMERMGRELVRLCDNVEKHGLVDYQIGVWEEEIITRKATTFLSLNVLHLVDFEIVLTSCLDLAESTNDTSSTAADALHGPSVPTAPTARRR
ncbi:hypothetical protein B0A49_10037 [Cryomyces minteri]|uniref:Uncharacterized protein n=1 Tax=Cryomyces minteri TaxID=331657 RepID=A0A4U0WUY3_9PEZI|nr:hypothetical protein B0A49_12898 [Cryomyces minteri]TKA58742.1 hypothetical protein B0A49_12751 [Cryomyces minteri]TKA66383.1 hypothetical protein B0A49_10037 [Cryomyces minteri]